MKSRIFQDAVESSAKVIGRKDVRVIFRGSEAHTDGKTITLPALPPMADVADDDANVMRGYRDHESMHIRCTDTSPAMLERLRQAQLTDPRLEKMIQLCEDIRIENAGVQTYYGMRDSIGALNYRTEEMLRNRVEERCKETGVDEKTIITSAPKFHQYHMALMHFGRLEIGVQGSYYGECAQHMDPELVKLAKAHAKRAAALDTGVKKGQLNESKSKKQTGVAFDLAAELLKEFIKFSNEQAQPPQQQPQQDGQPSDERSNDGQQGNSRRPSTGEAQKDQTQDSDQQPQEGSCDGSGSGSGDGKEKREENDEGGGSQQQEWQQGDSGEDANDQEEDGANQDGEEVSEGEADDSDSGEGEDDEDDEDEDDEDEGEEEGEGEGESDGDGGDDGGENEGESSDGSEDEGAKPKDGQSDYREQKTSGGIDGEGSESSSNPSTAVEFDPNFDMDAGDLNLPNLADAVREVADSVTKSASGGGDSRVKWIPYSSKLARVMTIEERVGGLDGHRAEQATNSYNTIADSIKNEVAMIRRRLEMELQARYDRRWEGGKKAGRLQPVRLVQAVQGHRNVFQKREDGRDMDTLLFFGIDMSGSMRNEKIQATARMTIAMCEALERTGCDMEIEGWVSYSAHNDSGANEMHQEHRRFSIETDEHFDRAARLRGYRDFRSVSDYEESAKIREEALKSMTQYTSLGAYDRIKIKSYRERLTSSAIRARLGAIPWAVGGGTPLVDSVIAQLFHVMTLPQKKKIMLILTDGQPDATYIPEANEHAMEDTHKLAAQNGVHIIGVGMDHDCSKYFKDSVIVKAATSYKLVIDKLAKLVAQDVGHARAA